MMNDFGVYSLEISKPEAKEHFFSCRVWVQALLCADIFWQS